ncbi:MAG: hypothetical protein ACLGIB_07475 [Actinomycetota bacterium]
MKKITSLVAAVLVLTSLAGLAHARGTRRPANDDLGAAVAVPALPFAETTTLRGATLEELEPQPTCKAIRSSVWYGFSVAEEGNVIGELSSTFRSSLAVFEQTAEGLVETACGFGQAGTEIEFKALPDRIYLIQLGATTTKQGVADLSLRLSEWREEKLYEYVYHQESEETYLPLVSVWGRQRENNPSMYDVTLGVSQQQPVSKGVLTFGLVTKEVKAELVRIPASTTKVVFSIIGRYDSSQYTCAVDDGGETCHAGAPIKDLNWLTSGDGSRAELVISLRAERNGEVLQERTIVVPYAGQVTGLLP